MTTIDAYDLFFWFMLAFASISLFSFGHSANVQEQSKHSAEDVADLHILRQLKEAGSDLSKPHEVNFYVYCQAQLRKVMA